MTEPASRRCPPLLVFADDWGRHPSSCQHLVRYLLGRTEVLWVNTIGTRPPRLDLMTVSRALEKALHWAGPGRGETPERGGQPGPRVLNPRMWPWFRTKFDRRLNRTLLARQLAPALAALPTPPIAVSALPIVADLVGELPVSRWVYYCVDDFSEWPGLDSEPLRRMEQEFVRKADVLIAVSDTLRDRLAAMGRSSNLLTHGIDLDHWAAVEESPVPPALDGLPRPLIVFWGVIDRRLDPRYLDRLAHDLGAGTILLVGPEQSPDPALRRLPHLHRLPPLPYEQLPGLARDASVLIMPYADLPVTRSIQPLKLKEYLATGRPVVVSDLPATRPWSDGLDLAGSPEEFSDAVRLRLATGLPDGQRAARETLTAEGWAAKARDFQRWINDEGVDPEQPLSTREVALSVGPGTGGGGR